LYLVAQPRLARRAAGREVAPVRRLCLEGDRRLTPPTVLAMPTLDPGSERDLYRQLADDLRRRIRTGDLDLGQELPREADLCHSYGVGIQTVRHALTVLRSEGLIERERGRPHRVSDRGEPVMAEAEPDAVITGRASGEDERRKYGIPEGTFILVISREGREEEIHLASRTQIRFRPSP
jgi:DNA-binding transcriptional regulator YhcF (GntR family)